ncbi:MAG TPA: type II toxin-antitoxin system PemK/MazF family toxin [Gemmataceae bacterium]|nr:type II toxin-antitoxin system PemK/MazF family toxin [Gemmataceae bacterium]
MKVRRGDVILTRVPHAAGGRGKKRPAVVVQADGYNQSERHTIVAEITSNLSRATDPAHLLIVVATPEGQATGLVQDSVVTCLQMATISEDRIDGVIGKLSAGLLAKLNDCLKAALEIH